jgi:hypothetical protein
VPEASRRRSRAGGTEGGAVMNARDEFIGIGSPGRRQGLSRSERFSARRRSRRAKRLPLFDLRYRGAGTFTKSDVLIGDRLRSTSSRSSSGRAALTGADAFDRSTPRLEAEGAEARCCLRQRSGDAFAALPGEMRRHPLRAPRVGAGRSGRGKPCGAGRRRRATGAGGHGVGTRRLEKGVRQGTRRHSMKGSACENRKWILRGIRPAGWRIPRFCRQASPRNGSRH